MFEDTDLDYAFRPGIVEAMLRHDKDVFKTKQIESNSDPTEVGKVAQAMVEEEYMQLVDDSQHNKYRMSHEIQDELERREHDTIADIMAYSKNKWREMLEEKTSDYDIRELSEDIPDGLHISETNHGVKKFLELKEYPLNDSTKQYLDDLGIIEDPNSMVIKADYIDIVMMKNYFEDL